MTLRFRLDGVDMGDTVVRLRDGIDGLTEAADGSVAFAGVQIEDPSGSLDLVGWHLFTVDEDACSQPRIFTGYLAARNISRGAYRTGAGRIWDCDVVDLNALLHLTALQKIRDDAMRPSETGTARINWLMGTLGMDGVIFDNGKVEANAWTYDETDYRGQYADDVLRDIVSASGIGRWTFFVYWDGSASSGEEVSLFYGELASTTYDSTLAISNVLSDVDSSTTFAPSIDATLERDPSDQYGGVYVTATFGRIYRTDPVTIAAMGITSPSGETLTRDGTYTSARLINAETADRHAETYLDWHSVEVDKITYEVILPKAKVNLLGAGMRAPHRFSHLPDYETDVDLRITRRTVLLTDNNPDYYRVQVEASLKGVLQSGAGDPGGMPTPDPADLPDHYYEGIITTTTPNHGPDQTEVASESTTLVPSTVYDYFVEITDSAIVGTTAFAVFALRADSGGTLLNLVWPAGTVSPPFSGSFTAPSVGWTNPVTAELKVVHNDVAISSATVHFWVDPDGWVAPTDDGDSTPTAGQWVFNETPTPTPGGGNRIFFTANPYIANSLQVFVDQVDQTAAVTETDPATGKFTLAFDPRSDETVTVNYQGRGSGS